MILTLSILAIFAQCFGMHPETENTMEAEPPNKKSTLPKATDRDTFNEVKKCEN